MITFTARADIRPRDSRKELPMYTKNIDLMIDIVSDTIALDILKNPDGRPTVFKIVKNYSPMIELMISLGMTSEEIACEIYNMHGQVQGGK
jgi:hypothetical protein